MRMGQSGKDIVKLALPALLAAAAAFYVAFLFVEPAPPDRLAIATGGTGGAYHHFAEAYREILAGEDVSLELRPTSGSVENLSLLADPDSGVDVAFVQGGLGDPAAQPDLVALASLYYEPIWIFQRGAPAKDRLSALAGKRIAIGPEGSGTRAVALSLLEANRLSAPPTRLLALGGAEAVEALKAGRVDAAFFVAGARSELILDLLRSEGLSPISLARAEGYAQADASFSTVTLHEGVIDFAANVPSRDVRLLAPAATLVARAELHPALVELLLRAAIRTHREGGLFEAPGAFPATRLLDFPLSEEARRFLERGPSLLNRVLPFWAANFLERMVVLLIPLITLMLPLMRFLPPVYRWRIRARIYRWYKQLRAIDSATRVPLAAPEQSRLLSELSRIEEEVKQVSVPLSYAEPLYHLRLHIELLRGKLRDAAQTPGAAPAGPPS